MAPYLREIMDTVSGREYQDITVVKCSQSGGTEVINNAVGYYIDQEPSSILVIQPNVKPMAEAWSKDRLAPMIRDSPRLRGRVRDAKARNSGNTVLHKSFSGGQITIAGANSPAGLASRPIRVVCADELDRWTTSAGTEGDPLSLADARQTTYRHRKKKIKVSSPGNEGESRIEKEWELSDQRHFYVPCPHCQHRQPLEWRDTEGKPDIRPGRGTPRVVWEKEGDEEKGDVVHKPETAQYLCRDCGALIDETHKPWMLANGEWVKHNPSAKRAGFHISGLLSPWVRWTELAAKWLAVKGDVEQMRTFFNTKLGLLFVAAGEQASPEKLAGRRERYAAEVPLDVAVLTAAVDVQDDRIEVEVRGWGAHEESWQIRLERMFGDPEEGDVWERLEQLLNRPWRHEAGLDIRIHTTMIDSGYLSDQVYRFVKPREPRRVFASKGVDDAKQPLARAQKANRLGVKLFTINPTSFKDTLFARLRRVVPGKGYLHFGTEEQTGADDAYFLQFGAEKRMVEWVKGRPKARYVNPAKKRNEAIDLYVLNLAALRSMGMTVGEKLGERAKALQVEGAARAAAEEQVANGEAPTPPPRQDRRQRGGGGWMNGFRR
jgi:phage terminase large subunit GpA-like protein